MSKKAIIVRENLVSTDRMEWFRQARFGMFINFGVYSLLGRGSEAMRWESIPFEDYYKLAHRLRPPADLATGWARLARRAGMKYVVFATKHCEGLCLFGSKISEFNSVRLYRRDFTREVLQAFRAEGLRVGLYHAMDDWRHEPYRRLASGDRSAAADAKELLHAHIRELLSNYGKIDLLWMDGVHPSGEANEFYQLARKLQPQIIVNDRAGVGGDFVTPENVCAPAAMGHDWELCTTIGDFWGYQRHDHNLKTVNQLIFQLANCATQGGNFLLNIAPRADGSVPLEHVRRLEAVGRWLKLHGEAVYGVERLSSPFWGFGRMTRKGRRLYCHCLYWQGKRMIIGELTDAILQAPVGQAKVTARVLTTGQVATCRWDGPRLVVEGLPAQPPDRADTVVILDVE